MSLTDEFHTFRENFNEDIPAPAKIETKQDKIPAIDTNVPSDFRNIVNELLSPEFGITVEDFTDSTDFAFTIIVPAHLKTISDEDRKNGVVDKRTKRIPRALGANGVREYVTLVRQNLNKHFQKNGLSSPFDSKYE